ncbi:MAG: hypothetical protein QOE44_2348 [Solirubrobacteraceae bacterium]|jgi:hypothetical protein|nr:hypothetical protein [Solirubrobacteraceae bacterium]
MTAVGLEIVKPVHDSVVRGTERVELQGKVAPLAPELARGVELHFRWYSSLHPGSADDYALTDSVPDPALSVAEPAGPVATGVWKDPLTPGTHAITLAVTDQPGQDKDSAAAVKHGGVTGGAQDPTPCVVHVLRAALAPAEGPGTLSRSGCTIGVAGPSVWTTKPYQDVNRVRFRFVFRDARGNTVADPAPEIGTVTPDADEKLVYRGPWAPDPDHPGVLRYQGTLPASLVDGRYTLSVRVEVVGDATVFDESTPGVGVKVVP